MTRSTCLAASVLIALSFAPAAAFAQDTGGRERAIIGGKDIQPHGTGPQKPLPEASRLLQENAGDASRTVVPHDIYGHPIGPDPGINPPGLAKQPQ